MHRTAVHSPPNLPAERQPRVKLPHLEMSADGLVSEAAMGIFRQQLTSYKRSLGIQADNLDSILQALPQKACSLLYERYGDALTAQAESELLTNIEALIVRPEKTLICIKIPKNEARLGPACGPFLCQCQGSSTAV